MVLDRNKNFFDAGGGQKDLSVTPWLNPLLFGRDATSPRLFTGERLLFSCHAPCGVVIMGQGGTEGVPCRNPERAYCSYRRFSASGSVFRSSIRQGNAGLVCFFRRRLRPIRGSRGYVCTRTSRFSPYGYWILIPKEGPLWRILSAASPGSILWRRKSGQSAA